ncbi:hypothetical protein SGLAD_v1c02120 [Spiroplasma gladiatoris]|uniref:Uncharacterized protein n=1 Tax=Spiroplasma gladiatoris TaxID=2143 RepID=A0A4P7AH24_9MOLU|nr:hypothetical protein [Spiroplasma gladiatoris]QBQ07411.1 hypothetical protein SGLAD_v1c02120 [Spiroplasma gladiatoris]
MDKNIWQNLLNSSNELVKNFDKENLVNIVKDFSESLVAFSEIYSKNREEFYKFINKRYKKFLVQAINIISSADSVAVIMQLNEGVNDYLILLNLFRQLLVTLDSLASEYWLQLINSTKTNEQDFAKFIIEKANSLGFEKTTSNLKDIKKGANKYKFILDNYYEEILNKELWKDLKELEKTIFVKPDGDFEYFKNLLAVKDDLAEDMIINLWAVLAIAISYLDYLNELLKGK